MPVTSHQMAGMIGGQQAMFGNFASYATQISPGYGGPPPTYSNPMQGAGAAFAPPPGAGRSGDVGTRAMSAIGNVGMPAVASAAMFLPGLDRVDPTMVGMRHLGRATGINTGGAGILSRAGWGNMASGARNFTQLGAGGMMRTGMGAVGGAAARAMPLIALGQAAKYGVGQMTQGAQFQNQVQGVLQNQFRQVNQGSRTGFGFSRQQGAGISDMLREMGHQDTMSSPQEMLKIMKQGSQMGLFRMVQDVKEFRTRFKETVSALKEVAKTMNTTLEGAMPFFQSAKQQGFWTPADIQRQAAQTRATASTTGMSVAQVQQMQQQGAGMARQIGAMGYQGAQGMTKALDLVGGGLRGGSISASQLSEATGGLRGTEAIQSMAGTLQGATTRFARGRQGRWMLAALGRKGFKGLDTGKMDMMMQGGYSIGDIGGMARRNIGKEGAFNFKMNEENLRGDMVKQGPMAQLGMIRTLIGGRLYGKGAKNKYITRRMMKRYFGTSSRQSDMLAQLARDAPQIMEQNMARSSEVMDQEERNRDETMNRSWEGVKRKASQWWDKNVKDPLQQLGARMSKGIGDWWERQTDKFWGRSPPGMRFRGLDRAGTQALQGAMLGDTGAMSAFTSAAESEQMGMTGMRTMGGKVAGGALGGYSGMFAGRQGLSGGIGGVRAGMENTLSLNLGIGGRRTNAGVETMRRLGAGEYAFKTEEERKQAVSSGQYVAGAVSDESAAGQYRAFATKDVKRIRGGLAFAASGTLTRATSEAIGMGGDVAKSQMTIKAAQKDMKESVSFMRAMVGSKVTRFGDMGRTDDLQRAQEMVQQIRSGEIKGEGLKALVGEAGEVSVQDAAMRLIGAQSREVRESGAGLDITELAKEAKIPTDVGDKEALITKYMEKQASYLGYLTARDSNENTGGAKFARSRSNTQKAFMDLYNMGGEVTNRFREGMTAWRRGTPKDKQRARKIWAKLGLQGKEMGLSDDQSLALRKMSQEKGDDQAALERVLDQASMGDAEKRKGELIETVNRRSRRLTDAMGNNMEKILGGMDEIVSRSAQGGEAEINLGTRVRDLISGDITSPEDFKQKMQELTEAAGAADPEQAFRAARLLRGYAGGEHLALAISAGAGARSLTKLAMKGGQRAAGAASQMISGLLGGGAGIDADDLSKLRTKPGSIDDIEKGLIKERHTGVQKENLRKLLEGLRDKEQEKIMKVGLDSAGARAVGIMGKAKDTIMGAEAGSLSGRTGSRAGMHIELGRQTAILKEINAALKGKPVVGAAGGKQGTKDKKPKEEG